MVQIRLHSPRASLGRRSSTTGSSSQRSFERQESDSSTLGLSTNMVFSSPTAPVVGPHKKERSLIGFDPLLTESTSSVSAQKSNGGEDLSPDEDRDVLPIQRLGLAELSSELRMIAAHLERDSPRRKNGSTKSAFTLSPRATDNVAPSRNTPNKTTSFSHRKTQSLTSVSNLVRKLPFRQSSENASLVKNAPSTPKYTTEKVAAQPTQISPVLEELLELHQQPSSIETLLIPSLGKPRPTSFLTGKEVVRSSEQDANEWQLHIPTKSEFETCTKLNLLVDTNQKLDKSVDITPLVGLVRKDLVDLAEGKKQGNAKAFPKLLRPIAKQLLACGEDIEQVRGYFRSRLVEGNPACCREVLVIVRQRQFLCVWRGTTPEQQGKFSRNPDPVVLTNNDNVTVFADRFSAMHELEPKVFGLLDKLAEEYPFCDVAFTGHSFGAAMASLAAYRYAFSRPELRVAALVTACPKAGMADFRLSANSMSNLSVVRLEYGLTRTQPSAGHHIGHTIRIHQSIGREAATKQAVEHPVVAYRFGDSQEYTGVRSLLFKKEKEVSDISAALESLSKCKTSWTEAFYRQDGAGVLGRDNEARQMA